ncbi:maleylpyruvate isomerase family mycothiol-dependent enzyme [Saccharopolyspora sp. HNM0986]|uniref:maleylpyruvate isomerase family mycothiol-dependent enzyme n=1 Tax=Saccharopolyspora galaxeae TaxID=2781241 RepID=UPI00190998F6|nr:maleylpyruvate isomerase family mycothiol-dependent enzyme [Saccharopolyspora sp. HNM0986]MBK0866196.1 maleylpyruvate isomerase family mycothiol-dependent enzyme [Saccharopolyspora sp. HNM0986]
MVGELSQAVLKEQVGAFRAAAVAAGPDATVPTCPGWDVRKLLRHLARVYAMVQLGLETGPDDQRPRPPAAPDAFDAALTWFDERFAELTTALSAPDPQRAVWAFFPGGTPESWTRRMTHETAIHRLDAVLAADGGSELIFDPELAADGIDEMLTVIAPLGDWSQSAHQGRVLYHAADAGRTWLVRFLAGQPPQIGAPADAALGADEVDATVAGTADAVYRRVWGRPSGAMITGDAALGGLVAGR